jgi:hypothetical protein
VSHDFHPLKGEYRLLKRAKNPLRVQQEVMPTLESFSFLFLFLFPLSPRPFLTKEKEERGKRKISGRVDITSCYTPPLKIYLKSP